jgi:hypothetical protein
MVPDDAIVRIRGYNNVFIQWMLNVVCWYRDISKRWSGRIVERMEANKEWGPWNPVMGEVYTYISQDRESIRLMGCKHTEIP